MVIDMDEAKRALKSALDAVNLPEGAQEPKITAISMNMMPVVALSVSSTTEDIVELTSTVEDIITSENRENRWCCVCNDYRSAY